MVLESNKNGSFSDDEEGEGKGEDEDGGSDGFRGFNGESGKKA